MYAVRNIIMVFLNYMVREKWKLQHQTEYHTMGTGIGIFKNGLGSSVMNAKCIMALHFGKYKTKTHTNILIIATA